MILKLVIQFHLQMTLSTTLTGIVKYVVSQTELELTAAVGSSDVTTVLF